MDQSLEMPSLAAQIFVNRSVQRMSSGFFMKGGLVLCKTNVDSS